MGAPQPRPRMKHLTLVWGEAWGPPQSDIWTYLWQSLIFSTDNVGEPWGRNVAFLHFPDTVDWMESNCVAFRYAIALLRLSSASPWTPTSSWGSLPSFEQIPPLDNKLHQRLGPHLQWVTPCHTLSHVALPHARAWQNQRSLQIWTQMRSGKCCCG